MSFRLPALALTRATPVRTASIVDTAPRKAGNAAFVSRASIQPSAKNWVESPKCITIVGIFYKDTVGKKRWMLKFDDAKSLEQVDAVFVTLEPNGESHKPSGKSLLFAYLKVNPNHP
jgi:hypothetical protein